MEIILFLFLLSINFNTIKFYKIIKKIIQFFKKDNEKNYTNKNEIIKEYIPQYEI